MSRNKLWRVLRLWPKGTCFILGGGPSLQDVDVEQLRGQRIIAVNNSYKLGDWFDAMFFGDCRWFNDFGSGLLDFAGLKITTCEQHLDKPGILVVKRKNAPYGLSRDPSVVFWNLSSGACAIGLAAHFGVQRIVLLGFDMRPSNGRHNWHDDYVPRRNPRFNPYPRFLRPFSNIAEDLKKMNIECFNATEGSALDVFPSIQLESVL